MAILDQAMRRTLRLVLPVLVPRLSARAKPGMFLRHRGRKTVMRFFPNQAADLEPVLALLERSEV